MVHPIKMQGRTANREKDSIQNGRPPIGMPALQVTNDWALGERWVFAFGRVERRTGGGVSLSVYVFGGFLLRLEDRHRDR